MTLDAISRDEALQVFGRRFDGAGLSDEEIAEHFDFLNAAAFSISAMGPMERFRCVCVGGDPGQVCATVGQRPHSLVDSQLSNYSRCHARARVLLNFCSAHRACAPRHGEHKKAHQRAANGRLPSVLFFAFCGGA